MTICATVGYPRSGDTGIAAQGLDPALESAYVSENLAVLAGLLGAADNLADAFRRGEQCTGDITGIDFLLRRDDRLVDVRAEYNIEAVIPGR